MNLIIPARLAQAIFDYLNMRPHGEVRQLIDGMSAMKPVEEPKPQEEAAGNAKAD